MLLISCALQRRLILARARSDENRVSTPIHFGGMLRIPAIVAGELFILSL